MLISFNLYINLSSDVLNQVLEMDVTEAVVGVARIDTTLVGVTSIDMTKELQQTNIRKGLKTRFLPR